MRACDACKRLHRRCDRAEPSCGLCDETGRKCVRSSSGKRFRFMRSFPGPKVANKPQPTVPIPTKVKFVSGETPVGSQAAHATSSSASPREPAVRPSPEAIEFPAHLPEPPPVTLLPFSVGGTTPNGDKTASEPLSCPLMSLGRRWSFKDSIEPMLLQHFTTDLACFFDSNDHERHFALQVPHRARSCPPLFDAILALSARHQSRVRKDLDPYLADYYYQRCLGFLIPELNRVGQTCVDDLLAATVILRLLEEFDVPLAGVDSCHHTVGTRALLRSQTDAFASPLLVTGLRRAATWAGLRQEIYASLSTQRRPEISTPAALLENLDPSLDDCAWANRAVGHCLEVIEFCFSEESTRGTSKQYDVLLESNEEWDRARPASYDPLCFVTKSQSGSAGDSPFWDVRLHTSWHVMGWQYRTLARILLITHDPRIPRIGLGRQAAIEKMNEQVRSAIRLICSIAESNATTPTAMVLACIAVRIGGDVLQDPRERRAVLSILTKLEALHGWPTSNLSSILVNMWPDTEKMMSPR